MRSDDTISINGQECVKTDEWKSGDDVYVLGNSVVDSDFFYVEVNGNTHFEYDHKPDREEIEEDYLNLEVIRDIDRHEAEVFSRFEGSDNFPDMDAAEARRKLESGEAAKEAEAMLAFAEQVAKENEVETYKRFSVTETSDAFAPGKILLFGTIFVMSISMKAMEQYAPLRQRRKQRNICIRSKRKPTDRKRRNGRMRNV